jgi:hypothetical protein
MIRLISAALAALFLLVPSTAEARHRHHGRGVAWCGIWMEGHTGIHGKNLARARAWAGVGEPANGPARGVIGVMPHHVFQVIAVVGPRSVLAISGNDDGAVRTRVRSTAGVIAWRSI